MWIGTFSNEGARSHVGDGVPDSGAAARDTRASDTHGASHNSRTSDNPGACTRGIHQQQ